MQTSSSFFTQNGIPNNNTTSLIGNLDELTNEQLKERLLVAEQLMKKLYERNKDIETYHKQKQNSARKSTNQSEGDNEVHELDLIQEFKKREEKLSQEILEKDAEIARLQLLN